jgi:hypothetical protein
MARTLWLLGLCARLPVDEPLRIEAEAMLCARLGAQAGGASNDIAPWWHRRSARSTERQDGV